MATVTNGMRKTELKTWQMGELEKSNVSHLRSVNIKLREFSAMMSALVLFLFLGEKRYTVVTHTLK